MTEEDIPTTKTEIMKVEDYLNSTSYEETIGYVPSEFALDFITFIKLVNGVDGEKNKTPLVHYRMLDTITKGGTRIANLCHRGIAKTTLMCEYLFLYLAIYRKMPTIGNVNFALYVTDSIDNGVKNARKNIEFRRNNSAFLMKYLPKARFTDIKWEFENIDGEPFIVHAYGAKTGVRGSKEMGVRPQLAILDDLVSDEDARSPTVIASIERTVYRAVSYALGSDNLNMIIWSGTPFNAKDPLYKAVESGQWEVNVFPVCEVFPCTKEEFRGSWPDRFSYEYVQREYDFMLGVGEIKSFNQELMLRIMSEEDRLIQDNDILWYDSRDIANRLNLYNLYITTDFATSETQSSDYSVISVWAYNNNGDWLWVDGICVKQTMDKNIEDLFRLAQKYKPQSVGIEVSGQQGGFIPWIQQQMLVRNTFFNLASENNKGSPGIRPNTNKLVRFNLMVPILKAQKMFFPENLKHTKPMVEAMEELSLVSNTGFKSKHDDFIDTISMLSSIRTWRPSVVSEMKKNFETDMWELEIEEYYNSYSSYTV